MTAEDGPVDPFLNDPHDPAAVLDDLDDGMPIEPLTDEERAEVLADLYELAEFRRALAPRGVRGVAVECADCGEQHFFSWDLMAANLRALIGEGRTHVHEPAFEPDPDTFVSWDYARGYTDATKAESIRRL